MFNEVLVDSMDWRNTFLNKIVVHNIFLMGKSGQGAGQQKGLRVRILKVVASKKLKKQKRGSNYLARGGGGGGGRGGE